MGLRAEIFKSAVLGDCSGGGISGRFDTVTLVNCDGPFMPREDAPAVMLINGPGSRDHVIAVPAELDTATATWVQSRPGGVRMFGGTFINSSDSRYHDRVAELGGVRGTAVQFHDRFER